MNPHPLDLITLEAALARLYSSQELGLSRWHQAWGNRPKPPWQFRLYQQLSSTNRTLWDTLQRGAPSHTVVIAQTQTQGKGQRGRPWQSAPGGLYLSAGVRLTGGAPPLQRLTLSTAWGIASSLRTLGVNVQLKWPNDLVVNDQTLGGILKLGGILIETRMRGDRPWGLCIGVGINGSNPVSPPGVTLQSLLAQRIHSEAEDPGSHSCWAENQISLNELAALTLIGIDVGLHRWQHDDGEAIAADYEALLAHRGQRILLPTATESPSQSYFSAKSAVTQETQHGVVMGVTPLGELRVQICPRLHRPKRAAAYDGSKPEISHELTFFPGTIRLRYSASTEPLPSPPHRPGQPHLPDPPHPPAQTPHTD